MRSITVTPCASWGSLEDWDVTQLELKVDDTDLISRTGSSILEIVAMLAPRLSSLDLILRRSQFEPQLFHIDDFEKIFCSLLALHSLHLTNGYPHLHAGGLTPWIAPRRSAARRNVLGTSICVDALDAMTWYMARVVQNAPLLELVHVSDEGSDKGRENLHWDLQVAYRVRQNEARDLEILGIPKLEMDPRFLPNK
ncbi:hypothetical protein DFH06DRAFT_1339445 [Mycena polygramma]|nr:hypothetical protein DFH06DRAFT_1339445 [Mycena polygramma]